MLPVLISEAESGKIKITDTGKYFEPLKLACETRQPRLMEIGLDAIHFLIGNGDSPCKLTTVMCNSFVEHGYLRTNPSPNTFDEDGILNTVSMESIIQCASSCSDEYDEVVQLQVSPDN